MTTGSRVVGNESSSLYFYSKIWNGSNGKSVVIPGPLSFYDRRIMTQPASPFTTHRGVTAFHPAVYSSKRIYRRARLVFTPTWNPYVTTVMMGTQTANKYGTMGIGFSEAGPFVPSFSANDYLVLQSRLANVARGHQFNMGVSLGEGRETMTMVVKSLARIHGAIKAVKRGRFDLACRALGAAPRGSHASRRVRSLQQSDISSAWLELQYGWMPLYQDIHESVRAYSALTNPARKSRITATMSSPFVKRWSPSGAQYFTRDMSGKVSRKIVAELTENLSSARSLGLADPLSVAWELVPFSFVADWFIPIGTYLDNLSIIPNLKARYLITTQTRYRIKSTAGPNPTYAGTAAAGTYFKLERSVSSTLPVPRPEFSSISEALSVGRIKNGIALLHNLVTS